MTSERPAVDGCYLCEIGTEGLFFTFRGNDIMVCGDCVMGCLLQHPKFEIFRLIDERKAREHVTN